MADSKISALPSASALDFTESFAIVQGGTTKKTPLSALAGRLFAKSAGLWYPLGWATTGALTAPADTSENTLATVAVPAGAMGPNGRLRITTKWSATNNGNVKTCRIRLSTTAYLQMDIASVGASNRYVEIANRNSQSAQVAQLLSNTNGWGTMGAPTTGTVDTSVAVNLTFTVQKATAGDTVTLEDYMVELFYAA